MPANTASKAGKSTQQSLLISEIKDGVVILRDGSIRGVILGSAINFELMSSQEQQGIEMAYQSFLNSLHFPIQIVIRSERIDLSAYIERMQTKRTEQANELLGALMDDYIANVKSLVDEVNIMDKQIYIVVPYFPGVVSGKTPALVKNLKNAYSTPADITVTEEDFKAYKQELSERMALVTSGLGQIGIRALALGTQELVDLYYTWYNPDVAHNQKLIDAEQLTGPVVLKGDGRAPHSTIEGGPF